MQKLKVLVSVTLALTVLVFSAAAGAKNLTHRLGVGLKNNTSESIPSLGVVYYPSADYAYTGGVGIDTEENRSRYQFHAGLRKIIYPENNLNFYVSGQAGLLSFETPATGTKSGLEFLGTFGAEFYFTGLENLGFTFEAGLGLSTANSTRIRTVADDPLHAGIIFFF